jgi:hypothetical protein
MFETLYDMYAGLDKLRCHLDANSVNTLNDPQVPSVGEHDNETAHPRDDRIDDEDVPWSRSTTRQ